MSAILSGLQHSIAITLMSTCIACGHRWDHPHHFSHKINEKLTSLQRRVKRHQLTRRTKTANITKDDINPFNASCSQLLLFEEFSAMLV